MNANPLWLAVQRAVPLALLLILSGCGGGNNSSSGCGVNCPPVNAEVLYVGSAGQIQIFSINTATGALGSATTLSGLTTAGSGTATPSAKFLYVADFQNNQIDGYSINATSGALTTLAGSPFPLGAIPNSAGSLAIDPGGKFLYATDLHGFNVLAFAINSSDGSLTPVPGSPFPSGFDPAGAVVDPSTKFLNVADVGVGSFGGISSYTINSANGALTAGAGGPLVVLLNGGVTDIAMHSSGKFLHVSTGISPTDSGVAAFTVNQTTGGLTQNGSVPFPTGLAPMRITLHSGGKFLYTANSGDGTISGFTIDAASGNLMPVSGSPFRIFATPPPGGLIAFDVAIDPSGQFLYAANPTASSVSGFRIDASTGSLSVVGQTSLTAHGSASFTMVKLP